MRMQLHDGPGSAAQFPTLPTSVAGTFATGASCVVFEAAKVRVERAPVGSTHRPIAKLPGAHAPDRVTS